MEQTKLVLVQDVREKVGKHNEITNYCQKINLPIVRKILNVGDYRLAEMDEKGNIAFINNISVDIKSSGGNGLQELASDLYRDKLAFNKKYRKSWQDGVKLIVLVAEEVKSLNDIVKWKNPHGKVSGRMLLDLMQTVQRSYGVDFKFCRKEEVGQAIIQLLKGEVK